MKGIALLQGEIIAKSKTILQKIENLFSHNQQAKFNQTWFKLKYVYAMLNNSQPDMDMYKYIDT
jgi:hypothetical protein